MKPEHQEKINELVDAYASTLKVRAQSLYSSGAIDVERFSVDEYALAKILLTAAIYDTKDNYAPLSPEYKKMVKNLKHF